MKLFIITQAVSDDDGNFYSEVHKVCKTEQEGLEELKKLHDKVVTYFENPDDDYDDGEWGFDISEEDDIGIRNYAQLQAVELN